MKWPGIPNCLTYQWARNLGDDFFCLSFFFPGFSLPLSLSLSFILVSLSLTLSLSLCFSWFLSLSLSQYLFSFFAWLIFLLKIIQANFTKSLWDICGRSCCIKIRQYAGTYKSILADFLTVQLIPVFALFK